MEENKTQPNIGTDKYWRQMNKLKQAEIWSHDLSLLLELLNISISFVAWQKELILITNQLESYPKMGSWPNVTMTLLK